MNPRDGGFPKRSKVYISSLKLACFAGSGVKISFILRGRISTQEPKIVTFSCSNRAYLFDSFGPGVKIRKHPLAGGFTKGTKLYT